MKPSSFFSLGITTVGMGLLALVNASVVNAGTIKRFSLKNNTDVVIVEVEAATLSGNDWGTIKEGRLVPGDTAELTFDDDREDCSYNFRVYYMDDGKKYYKDYANVSVCNNAQWSVP